MTFIFISSDYTFFQRFLPVFQEHTVKLICLKTVPTFVNAEVMSTSSGRKSMQPGRMMKSLQVNPSPPDISWAPVIPSSGTQVVPSSGLVSRPHIQGELLFFYFMHKDNFIAIKTALFWIRSPPVQGIIFLIFFLNLLNKS